jgi:predicted transcriptional regulator/DNA-binding XRE family transcriptional regulator
MEEDYIKLIFGLKLKQIRTDKGLSLFGLSKLTGLSKSYLNEIEKGKKYPKPDKIILLAEHLDTPYDEMVSLKLDKNLAPVGEILKSKLLKEIPLELFGIQEQTLIDIISNAPAKVTAFISTIIEIAKNYNFSKENFYLASVRSFQEANNNFFKDIEDKVLEFSTTYQIDLTQKIKTKDLEEILIEEYGYKINNDELENHKELDNLRSVYIPKSKTLLITKNIDDAQRAFIYAKELGYNFMNISIRPYTFTWIKFEGFDEVLNNFYASYFAGALTIPRKSFVSNISNLLELKKITKPDIENLFSIYNASAESIFQRMTNVLPKDLKLGNIFFLRFSYNKNTKIFRLNKELHLEKNQTPRARENNEHYCQRWASLKVLKDISVNRSSHEFEIQVSHFSKENSKYLILSSASQDPFKDYHYRSVSIGIEITKDVEKKIKALKENNIKVKEVGVTCERCTIKNCTERLSEPVVIKRHLKDQETLNTVTEITEKYSNLDKR